MHLISPCLSKMPCIWALMYWAQCQWEECTSIASGQIIGDTRYVKTLECDCKCGFVNSHQSILKWFQVHLNCFPYVHMKNRGEALNQCKLHIWIWPLVRITCTPCKLHPDHLNASTFQGDQFLVLVKVFSFQTCRIVGQANGSVCFALATIQPPHCPDGTSWCLLKMQH